VRPQDLIGYAPERALLRRNTVQLLAGYPANNVLLYGDRGTGKSSSVKALLHEPAPHEPGPRSAPDLSDPDAPPQTAGAGAREVVDWGRLRLIEVPKGRLGDFPLIVALLRGRPQRFVLFIDDLSFEEGETQYKDMKAMLEGGLEARPPNAVVYATSNRRHLIREQFADRPAPGTDEVHAMDTVQEKLSFADRFGLTITFPSPNQAAYLAIVEGLARQRGLTIAPAALRARAIEWAAWHNGRSGRTARQFVDHLTGELGLGGSNGGAPG
jgi:predicted AAA+ superfamily ATPase